MYNETGNSHSGNGSYGNSINSFITCIKLAGNSLKNKTRIFEMEGKILLQVLLVHHVLSYGYRLAGITLKLLFAFIFNNFPFYMKNLYHTDDPDLNFFPCAHLYEIIPVHSVDGFVNSPVIINP